VTILREPDLNVADVNDHFVTESVVYMNYFHCLVPYDLPSNFFAYFWDNLYKVSVHEDAS
jgi:hypothetical protein